MGTYMVDYWNALTDLGDGTYRHDFHDGVIKWSHLIPKHGRSLIIRENGRPTAFMVACEPKVIWLFPLCKPANTKSIEEFGRLFAGGIMS